MNSLKSFSTLKTNKQYLQIYRKGVSFHSLYFVIFFLKNNKKQIGFVASKKVGNAVCRNRCKRLMREVFYHSYENFLAGTFVFVAKQKLLNIDFHTAVLEYNKMYKKMLSKGVLL